MNIYLSIRGKCKANDLGDRSLQTEIDSSAFLSILSTVFSMDYTCV